MSTFKYVQIWDTQIPCAVCIRPWYPAPTSWGTASWCLVWQWCSHPGQLCRCRWLYVTWGWYFFKLLHYVTLYPTTSTERENWCLNVFKWFKLNIQSHLADPLIRLIWPCSRWIDGISEQSWTAWEARSDVLRRSGGVRWPSKFGGAAHVFIPIWIHLAVFSGYSFPQNTTGIHPGYGYQPPAGMHIQQDSVAKLKCWVQPQCPKTPWGFTEKTVTHIMTSKSNPNSSLIERNKEMCMKNGQHHLCYFSRRDAWLSSCRHAALHAAFCNGSTRLGRQGSLGARDMMEQPLLWPTT